MAGSPRRAGALPSPPTDPYSSLRLQKGEDPRALPEGSEEQFWDGIALSVRLSSLPRPDPAARLTPHSASFTLIRSCTSRSTFSSSRKRSSGGSSSRARSTRRQSRTAGLRREWTQGMRMTRRRSGWGWARRSSAGWGACASACGVACPALGEVSQSSALLSLCVCFHCRRHQQREVEYLACDTIGATHKGKGRTLPSPRRNLDQVARLLLSSLPLPSPAQLPQNSVQHAQ